MKTRSLAMTIAAITVTVLGAGTTQGAEVRLRGPAKVPAEQTAAKGQQRVPTTAAALDAGLLAAAATAARQDSDPELNGAIQDPRPIATAAARR